MARKKKSTETTVYYIAPPTFAAAGPPPPNQQQQPVRGYGQQPSLAQLQHPPQPVVPGLQQQQQQLLQQQQQQRQPTGLQLPRDVSGLGSILMASGFVDDPQTAQAPVPSTAKSKEQEVFIHRPVPETITTPVPPISSVRAAVVNKSENKPITATAHTGNGTSIFQIADDTDKEDLTLPLRHLLPQSDLIFSNGNNREKRRVELFEKYSELYKFKEQNRAKLYKQQMRRLNEQMSAITADSEPACLKDELIDLAEERDFELLRVYGFRSYRRDENLKTYYSDTTVAYKEAYTSLNSKLDSLKTYLTKQRSQLANLDRDFTEIGSSRASKFFTGFEPEPQVPTASIISTAQIEEDVQPEAARYESSETDTGATSTASSTRRKGASNGNSHRIRKQKSPSQNPHLLSSILTGLSPLLTPEELDLVMSNEIKSRTNGADEQPKRRGPARIRNTDGVGIGYGRGKGFIGPQGGTMTEVDVDLELMRMES